METLKGGFLIIVVTNMNEMQIVVAVFRWNNQQYMVYIFTRDQ
jgi:hypothetical protein